MARLHFIDFAIIVLVLGVTVFLGFRFSKKQNSTQNFFLSKGNIPSWALGLSLLATLISSVTFLGYPAQGYTGNWILLVQGLMVPVILLGCIWFIVPLFRKSIGLSTYEYFEKRFGSFARYYTSLSFVVRQFAGMGTVLFLIAIAIREMIHVNPFLVLAVVALILIVVNLKGGIQAVIWLDVFQGFMLFFSGIVCLVVLLNSIKGGVPEAIRIATENQRTGFGPYDFSFKHLTFIVMVVNGAFYAVQKYATDQTVVQRYLTAKSDKDAIRASFLGISLTVPIWTLFMLIGTALFVYYKQQGVPAGMKAEAIFPHFIMTQLPPGIIGFIIAALLSAAICSLSADLNALAAVGVEDYYKKMAPGREDTHYLQAGKLLVIFSGLLAAGIGALYIISGDEGVLGIIFTVYAIFSGGIVGIFLLGLFSSRANRQGVTIAIIVCIVFTAYAFLTSTPVGLQHPKLLLDLGPYNFTHNKLMLGVYSHLVVIVVGSVASLFFPKPDIEPNLLFANWKKNRKNG
ncbi:MAG: sodium:solute symporter [Niabella sp.]|nr:sodium:solute symporter [Niabella sp.]